MPVPSDIQILYDGTDITNKVLFASANFEAQASGGVGTFSFTVKDTARNLSFTTGKEVLLILDDVPYFGGYLMQNGQRFAFPVVNSSDINTVTARQFALHGTNYNVLFDRLVTRDTGDYLHRLPAVSGNPVAGDLVTDFATNYLDLPAGFDVVSFVDPVGITNPDESEFNWLQQGTPWRQQLQYVSQFLGSIYYIDASKNLQYHAPENVFSRWGFSDRPNHDLVLAAQTTFSGATYGFREMTTTQDIANIINDILVWGGSPWTASDAPGASGTVFARRTNDTSIALNGRWQKAENRIGSLASQEQVDTLADFIVPPAGSDLPPGLSPVLGGVVRNASVPSWSVNLTWFAHDVPTLDTGGKDHLVPGDVVTMVFYVHGTDLTHPLILTLPLRQVSIDFPTLPSSTGGDPQTYARFRGQFSLSLDDPFSLWEAILSRRAAVTNTIYTSGSPAAAGIPGGQWQGAPDETANGTLKTFTLSSASNPIVYVAATSLVYVNGLLLRPGADYSEAPNDGTITFFVAPSTGSVISVTVRLAG